MHAKEYDITSLVKKFDNVGKTPFQHITPNGKPTLIRQFSVAYKSYRIIDSRIFFHSGHSIPRYIWCPL